VVHARAGVGGGEIDGFLERFGAAGEEGDFPAGGGEGDGGGATYA
jgi:hypothetical protein